MIIKGIDHLLDLVEAIHKKERSVLACVADQFHDLMEACFHHVFVQTKGDTINHVKAFCRPPKIMILDAEEVQHEEDTPQPNIELLEVYGYAQSLVVLWDDRINNPLFWEVHVEQLELIHTCHLFSPVMNELAFLIREVGVCTAATILGLFPCAGRRRRSLHRRLVVLLWRWLVVIINSDALLVELLGWVTGRL
jgi:hypothetical protein